MSFLKKLIAKTGQSVPVKNIAPALSATDAGIIHTTSGEIFQPVRIRYQISGISDVEKRFRRLACMDSDPNQKRWVWLHCDEAARISLKKSARHDPDHPTVLGSFLFKGSQDIVLDVRSIERATQAILFFDKHIPRKMMRLKDGLIVNKLFGNPQDGGVSTFDRFFASFDTTGPSPSALPDDLESRMAAAKTPEQKTALIHQLTEGFRNKPLPEVECFPIHFYEEGIRQLELMLKTRQHVAYQHFIGNKNYTLYDYAMPQA